MQNPIIAVSGGFDPVHVGHLDLINDASKHGNVLVIVNQDHFLMKKKGYVFMPFEERILIMQSLKKVWCAVGSIDKDMSVCRSLILFQPDIFANGGDRRKDNIPEIEVCDKFGIELIFDMGYKKIRSSSQIINRFLEAKNDS